MSGNEEGRPHDAPGPEAAENAFALAFPKGDESFPVLKAFQEFLDAERERARRRQMTLTICFMSAIVVLVVLFCVVGAMLFGGMMRRSDAQQAKMLDILMQRMPAAAGAPVAAAPVAQPAPAPQVTELLDVIQSLKAQNAEMMTALQERLREPVAAEAPAPKTVVPSAPKTAQTTAEADARARKAGIFSSPRRKAEAPAVAEAPVQEELAHEAPAPEAPAPEADPFADLMDSSWDAAPAEPMPPAEPVAETAPLDDLFGADASLPAESAEQPAESLDPIVEAVEPEPAGDDLDALLDSEWSNQEPAVEEESAFQSDAGFDAVQKEDKKADKPSKADKKAKDRKTEKAEKLEKAEKAEKAKADEPKPSKIDKPADDEKADKSEKADKKSEPKATLKPKVSDKNPEWNEPVFW